MTYREYIEALLKGARDDIGTALAELERRNAFGVGFEAGKAQVKIDRMPDITADLLDKPMP